MGTFHNYTIVSAPPPSSGGVVLVSALNILEGYDLAKLGDRTAAWIHLITEAYRRAYMDRTDYLGDPDYNQIPVAELTAKKYAEAWRDGHRFECRKPKRNAGPAGRLFAARSDNCRASPRRNRRIRRTFPWWMSEGNAVSVTTTLNDSFRLACDRGIAGIPAERRDGRLCLEDGRAEYVRLDPGSGECNCAGQAAA